MKKVIKFFTSSKFLLALTFLINVILFVCITMFVGSYVYTLLSIISLVILLGFLNKENESPSYKIMWAVIIIGLPVFGIALYMQLKTERGSKRQRKRYKNVSYSSYKFIEQNPEVMEGLVKFDPGYANISKYLLNTEKWPIYGDTTTEFLKDGETYFTSLFETLKKAKKFILLEYFILEPGKVWDELFNILRHKAREGVEIKLIYDDFGCVDRFNDKKFFEKLKNHGIETVSFNRIVPTLNTFSQYRDHRKIVVVDGITAFTGGINVADEYANIKERFGEWKDTGMKIVGPATWSFTVMFLNNWQVATKRAIDLTKYQVEFEKGSKIKDFVQPYGTGPISKDPIARNTFLRMIDGARKYVYITTPYFIIDHEMTEALRLAALSGVDVRIVMPGIPDKKWVFYLSRSYYSELIKAGVKIFEYTPGFVHAKMIVIDDCTTIVGTTNFDFRSLYLHFEDGIVVHNSKTVVAVKQDIETMIGSSHEFTLRDVKQRKWYEKFSAQILKFFAPLM